MSTKIRLELDEDDVEGAPGELCSSERSSPLLTVASPANVDCDNFNGMKAIQLILHDKSPANDICHQMLCFHFPIHFTAAPALRTSGPFWKGNFGKCYKFLKYNVICYLEVLIDNDANFYYVLSSSVILFVSLMYISPVVISCSNPSIPQVSFLKSWQRLSPTRLMLQPSTLNDSNLQLSH